MARRNTPDPGVLGEAQVRRAGKEGKGAWLKDVVGPGTWPSIPSWFAPNPWRNVTVKPSGEEWKVGKACILKGGLHSIETHAVCQGGHFSLGAGC